MSQLQDLKAELAEVTYMLQALGLLEWDQQTYMPSGAAESRAFQESTLHKVCHERRTSDMLGRLLDGAEKEVAGLDPESLDYQLVRMTRYDFDRARKLPPEFVAESAHTNSLAMAVWGKARSEDDFASFAPWLQKSLDLAKRKVDYLGYDEQPYDALLGCYEAKMRTSEVNALFAEVRPVVVDIVKKVQANPGNANTEILSRRYPEDLQEKFARVVVRAFGYDFNRGRLDRTIHPFASAFSKDDCRITTRYDANFLPMALMGTMHETGHAMYEQNTGDDLRGTPLADGCSNSLHESQSRLWENLVGRSRGFWGQYFPLLQETFPDALGSESAESLYRALNVIEPSFIRVEADEVTYNLHIILRFELEQDLLMGRLKVSDAPEAWNAKVREYLGITPPTNREGVLQDVHWAMGGMGYFPTYSLGNFLSAQIFAKVVEDIPDLDQQIAAGRFKGLFDWLESHVWRYGRRNFPQEQIVKSTGSRLKTGPYVAYLRSKFGQLYDLSSE
jgi:carboxypeptidase Taq